MPLPIQLVSTDFDGTFFAEFENPPVPPVLQAMIRSLQDQGAKWVINTGRDLSSLMETLGRGHVTIQPDYLVLVEREIHVREAGRYVPLLSWNEECTRRNRALFDQVSDDLPELAAWIHSHCRATLYADAFSPLCMIADSQADADAATAHLEAYAAGVPNLSVVRNDVYLRFSHDAFNKGSSLSEIGRQTGIDVEHTFAIGDHWNDLPMLLAEHARYLAAPANAVDEVKEQVRRQGGYVSGQPCGHGVARSLEYFFEKAGTGLGGG